MRPEPNENRQLALSRLMNRQLALSRLTRIIHEIRE
jgi:hypothetical protein